MSYEQILVRYGWQAIVGKFSLPSPESDNDTKLYRSSWTRGARIVVNTPRGLEFGISLGPCQVDEEPMGTVLRPAQAEDELLEHHLRRLSELAQTRCNQWLVEQGHQAVLLEVEPLLDGQTLYFHFLSGVDEFIQQQVEHFVRLYEEEVAASDFAQKVLKGCGPGCGTEKAAGKGCSSCSNCRICVTQTRGNRQE